MADRVKVLWFGDLSTTGFGTVTSDVGRAMIDMEIDIRFVSQFDYEVPQEPFASRTLDISLYNYNAAGEIQDVRDFVPRLLRGETQGMKLINGQEWGEWKADACFLLGDFYGLREMVTAATVDAFRALPTFHYAPIEGSDLPPNWNAIWSIIKPIAMSRFGQTEIEKVTGIRPPLVYHGVDAETFHPVSATNPVVLDASDNGGERLVMTSKAACKFALFGSPDVQIAFRADRFMPRKGYDSLLRAMAPVLRSHPNMVLVLHCRERDFGGYLPDSVSKYPDLARQIVRPQWGPLPRSVLVTAYNAADVYVSTSAEGFGLTLAEAIACGVPAVGLDYSAVPEVIGPAGTVVPVGKYLDNEYGHLWALPDEERFGDAVSYLIDHPHRRVQTGLMGPPHVRRKFDWSVAAQRFVQIAQNALRAPEMASVASIPQPDVSDSLQLVAA